MANPNTTEIFESEFFSWAEQNGETFDVTTAQVLISEGIATPNLYILIGGNGQVTTASMEGETVDLALIERGQFVGEMSLLEDRLPVANVEALPGSRWIRISHASLMAAMGENKPLAASTYLVFAGKLAKQLSSQNAFIHRWPNREVEPLRKVLLVFGEWNEVDVAWLARQGNLLKPSFGDTVISEGVELDQIFVVLDGEADVLIDVDGEATTVGSSRRGEILGEMSFLGSDERATASVRARVPMQLLAVAKAIIRDRLLNDYSFAQRFNRSLAVLLSHRCRDQLMSRGLAAQAAHLEELDLTTLTNVSTAGRRFEWLCQEMEKGVR